MKATVISKPLCLSCEACEAWLTAQGYAVTKIGPDSTAALVLLAELDIPLDESLELPIAVLHGFPASVLPLAPKLPPVKGSDNEAPEPPAGGV